MMPYPYGPINPNQEILEAYVQLNAKQRSAVRCLIGTKEKVLYAGTVEKINKHQTPQQRILVITDKTLYNIDPDASVLFSLSMCSPSAGYSLKRKIDAKKIFGATISINPTSEKEQFIIHVQGEYDYRYNGGHNREKIIKSLMNTHFLNTNQPFILYCKEEADLAKYHTTDDDVLSKKNKRPTDGKIFVTQDLVSKGLQWIIFNRHNFMGGAPLNGAPNMPIMPNQGYPQAGPGNVPGPYAGPGNQGPYAGPGNQGPYFPNQGGAYPPLQTGPVMNNAPGAYPNLGPTNTNFRPPYYVPETKPYQPNNQVPPTTLTTGYQQPSNQPNTVNQGFGNQGYGMQPTYNQGIQRPATTGNNFGGYNNSGLSAIQPDLVAKNSGSNAKVQITTNFDAPSPTQQYPNYYPYNGNNVSPNYRAPGNPRNY